jgi:hypothetical protein
MKLTWIIISGLILAVTLLDFRGGITKLSDMAAK